MNSHHRQHSKTPALRLALLALAATLLVACSEPEAPMALGTLERDRVSLRATAAQIIRAQPQREGASVQAGDILGQLDSTQQQYRVTALQAELEALRQQLQRLQNGFRSEEIAAAQARVRAVEAALDEQQRNVDRLRVVAERDFAARAELETAEARRNQQQALLEEAQQQVQLLQNGSREEDIAAAQASVAAAEAQLAREQELLQELTIIAPDEGLLEQLPWEVGERVQPGTVVAVLLTGSAPYARVYIPEPWRLQINIGSSLPVYIDGREQPLQGEVRWIASEPAFTPYYALNREERSRLMYLAEIQLPSSAADLPAGLPAQAGLPQ
jgi:HlyD family secretion protein